MCTFNVQSVVCGNYTGNQRSSVTVKLRGKNYVLKLSHSHIYTCEAIVYAVPGVPEIVSILPYYSNKFKYLTRVHVQVTMPNTVNSH